MPGVFQLFSHENANHCADFCSINLYGLAADVNPLGSAYTEFAMISACNATYTAYPFVDPPAHYYDWHALGFNLFRLPAAWQHLAESLGGPLNQTNIAHLDSLIETITGNGSVAIIDVVGRIAAASRSS